MRDKRFIEIMQEADRVAEAIDGGKPSPSPAEVARDGDAGKPGMYTEKLRRSLTRLGISDQQFAVLQERSRTGRIIRQPARVQLRDAICYDLHTKEMLSYPEIVRLVYGHNGNASAYDAARRHERWLKT